MGKIVETVKIEIPIKTIDETKSGISSASKNIEKLNSAVNKAGNSADKAREKVSKFDNTQEKVHRSLSQWVKEKYEILLEARERITPILRTLGKGLRNLTGRTWRITMRAIDLVTSPARGIINLLKNPIFQAGAVPGVSIGLKDTIGTYKDFEAAMSQVSAVSGATGSDLEKLSEKAKKMGASTKFTATEAAEGFNYMSMAGWKTQDMLDGIEGIMSLAAASGEDLATTSDIVTDALTAFNLKASDSGHFADVLAAASSNANTNVSMLGESFKYVAPVAGAMKYSVEDVSLALGLMANASVKSSMAGTSLKTAIANMAAPTDKMQAAMKKYHISLTDSKGKTKEFRDVLDNARKSLGNLSETEQTAAIKTIFGKEAMAGMAAIITASEKDYNKLAKAINNADGASKKMEDTMLDNLEGSITLFQSALDGAKLSLGERLSPYVRGAADWLAAAMPDVEAALDKMMDWVEHRADQIKYKFSKISLTDKWQTSDFFGKAHILWDEFISEPLAEWWKNTGKAKVSAALGDFGELIGSGLHTGIMMLLGFDVSDISNEGASIGEQFAKGFADGFDFNEISKKLWEGLGNIVKNASKLLPGGESADLSSLLSAALLARMAGPLLNLGSGAVNIGKALFSSGGATGGVSLVGSLLGSASAGTGLLGFGANTAINLGAGNLAGGASLSAGALSAIGLGSVAGGVAGAVGLIHGGMDLYTGLTSDDEEKAAAYKKAAAVEIGGTLAGAGAGAATGAAIGAVFGGVGAAPGALIGAGIGAIGSWIAGNKIKEDYEENAEEAAKAAENARKVYEVTGRNIDEVKFKTKALNAAMKDSEVSAEEFANMYQEVISKNMAQHFGKVSLSLKEIKQIADDTVISKQANTLSEYTEAAEKTSNSLAELESSMTELEKQNWKAGLGGTLSESDSDNYKNTIQAYSENAKNYLENQHYQATLAVELLVGKKGSSGITKNLDSMYGDMESQLDKLSKRLSRRIENALSDGVVSAREEKTITKLQNKIKSITQKISDASDSASLKALNIKFGKGKLDAESFSYLQEELAMNTQSMSQQYSDALQTSLENLERMKPKLKKGEYKKMYNQIKEDYNSKISGLSDRSEDFQLGMIVENYKAELDGILPQFKGGIKKRLKQAMSEAFVYEPDAAKWDDGDIVKWFGLENLSGESQGAVAQMLKMVAASVPDGMKDIITDTYKDKIPTVEEIIKQVDFTTFSWDDYAKIMGFNTKATYSSGAETNPNLLTGNENNFEEKVKKLATDLHKALEENMNPEEVREFISNYMNSSVSEVDKETLASMKESGNNFGNSMVTGAQESILNGSSTLRSALENSANTAAAIPLTPNVQINPNYIVTPYDKSVLNNGNGGTPTSPTATPEPARNAAGGYAANKQLSWLAEEGYGEFIIPTNPSRRGRALELYKQAGRALGIQEHAAGGFVGELPAYADESDYSDDTPTYSAAEGQKGDSGGMEAGRNISVSVQMSPEFNISGSDNEGEEKILAIIKSYMMDLADELGGEIATQLEDIFSNMPVEG